MNGTRRGLEPLTLDEYQFAATRTVNAALDHNGRLIDAAAGLVEEGGEVLGLIRKHLYHGRVLDSDRVTEELGDALWCVAALASALGVSLRDVAARNLNKLQTRYPDGLDSTLK